MRSVRAARPGDLDALLAIDIATWSADVSPGAAPDPETAMFTADLGEVLVAEVRDQVIGYVHLERTGPQPAHDHVLTINGFAVAPAHQGAGHGRALLRAALDEARRRDARRVCLRVLASNPGARRLYESCGFVVEGVLQGEFRLNGWYIDDLLMAREIRPAGASP